jgi:hypothetical protein
VGCATIHCASCLEIGTFHVAPHVLFFVGVFLYKVVKGLRDLIDPFKAICNKFSSSFLFILYIKI